MIGKYLNKLKEDGWLADMPDLIRLMNTNYGRTLMIGYKNLKPGALYKSSIHGRDHVERVMLFGALIAMKQKLSIDDTRLLLIACSYHDCGRINDYCDPKHGMRSAKKLNSIDVKLSDCDKRLIQAAIAAHSLDDDMICECMDTFRVKNRDRCEFIFKCLKDADALDRVRFAGLNQKYLRLDMSKDIAKYAMKIFERDVIGNNIFKSISSPPGSKNRKRPVWHRCGPSEKLTEEIP